MHRPADGLPGQPAGDPYTWSVRPGAACAAATPALALALPANASLAACRAACAADAVCGVVVAAAAAPAGGGGGGGGGGGNCSAYRLAAGRCGMAAAAGTDVHVYPRLEATRLTFASPSAPRTQVSVLVKQWSNNGQIVVK